MHRDFLAWLETQTGVPTEFEPRVPLGQRRFLSREVLAETFLRFNVLLILAEDGCLRDRGAAVGDPAGDDLYDARDLLSENGTWEQGSARLVEGGEVFAFFAFPTRPTRRDSTPQHPTGLDRALEKVNEGRVLERFFVKTWANHQCPGREDKCTSLATADGHVKLSHTVCAAEQGGRVVEKPETGPVNHGCTLAPKQGSIFCKQHHELFAVKVSAARAARAEKKRTAAIKKAKALRAAQGAQGPLAEVRHQCTRPW